MSWWVNLTADGEPVRVGRHSEGGTYVLGGVDSAELNVTYNYGMHFREALPELAEGSDILARMLGKQRAGDTIDILERAVDRLGTDTTDDYWESTPGNAGYALAILLSWAREHPDATWDVS